MEYPKALIPFREDGERLFRRHLVKRPLFSRSTYSVEVMGTPHAYPLLVLTDGGEMRDGFCTCEESSSCPHLAAAFSRIFAGTKSPLHIRFEASLWNHLGSMLSERLGNSPSLLIKKGEKRFEVISKTKQILFSIEFLDPSLLQEANELFAEFSKTLPENSFRLSPFSTEEIALFREGLAGPKLRYELSFWAELMKMCQGLQDELVALQWEVKGSKLPRDVAFTFVKKIKCKVYIPEATWPMLIASLPTVSFPLPLFGAQDPPFCGASYEKGILRIQKGGAVKKGAEKGERVGDYLFVPGVGFFPAAIEEEVKGEYVESEIAPFLDRFADMLSSFLPVQKELIAPKYHLSISEDEELVVSLFAFAEGDLVQADFFAPWVYFPDRGFFRFEELLFEKPFFRVKKGDVAEFVGRNRVFLQRHPGFQTHLGSLQGHLFYAVEEDKTLSFHAKIDLPEATDLAIHFGEWIYIKGQGFYRNPGEFPIHPGMRVKREDVGLFIASRKEELEQVDHFFSKVSPIERIGLEISVNREGRIDVKPRYEYAVGVDPASLILFGDYVLLEGKGFSLLPPSSRLPDRFREPVTLLPSHESAFLTYDLPTLAPFILSIDHRLEKPEKLRLKIVRSHAGKKKKEWHVQLLYLSDRGAIGAIELYELMQEKKGSHLFTTAGLLFQRDPRFAWLRLLPKRKVDRKRGVIKLELIDWIRLSLYEEMATDEIFNHEIKKEIEGFHAQELPSLHELEAKLRPYQEEGLKWLYFLYAHSLSGLLCDDMGLGKTLQAIALIAAERQVNQGSKYLVVCPTSVLYHWQELLNRFLPAVRVMTYYGIERSLDSFEEKCDLLLTSYGILRMGNELKGRSFEIAIFDEIQIAKNEASQTHKALCSIKARMRLGLTGTPIENRIRELKALFDIALPGYMPPEGEFREIFVGPIEKENDSGKKELLSRLIKPFLLRRKKGDVLKDLPEKTEQIAYSDLSAEQQHLYKKALVSSVSRMVEDLEDKEKAVSYVHIFALLSSLKQLCDHPALYLKVPGEFEKHQSGKWDQFVELVSEARASGQKVVVFSQYLDMLSIMESHFAKKGIAYAMITGATKDRAGEIKRFREDPKCEIFLASLLAAGVGIDLTVASVVIHYDRWWNPAKENQATDRVHRIGQSRGVQVFKLVAKGTIEEEIHALIERKKGLLDDIVREEEGGEIKMLTREELLQVFRQVLANTSA